MGKRPPPPFPFNENTKLPSHKSPAFGVSPPSNRLPDPTILPTAYRYTPTTILKGPASLLPSEI